MNLNEKCLLKFLQYPDELTTETAVLENILEELKKENELLKQNLEHCANQFTNDGKNVLLGLK